MKKVPTSGGFSSSWDPFGMPSARIEECQVREVDRNSNPTGDNRDRFKPANFERVPT